MSSFEFVLAILTVFMLFLAFAMATMAMLLGSKKSQAEVRKLFQTIVKALSSLLSR
jgi:flagellar basal body-associated protein FliL